MYKRADLSHARGVVVQLPVLRLLRPHGVDQVVDRKCLWWRVWDLGCRVKALELRVQAWGFRVEGLGLTLMASSMGTPGPDSEDGTVGSTSRCAETLILASE